MVQRLLHDSDDEFDLDVYRSYLTSQNDNDLSDIGRHLDPDQFPARSEAVRKELKRRRLPLPAMWPPEASFNRWAPSDAFLPTSEEDIAAVEDERKRRSK